MTLTRTLKDGIKTAFANYFRILGGIDASGNPQALTVTASGGLPSPTVTADIDAVTTSATGTLWVRLPTHTAVRVTISNTTGQTLSVRHHLGTGVFPLVTGSSFTFKGITNANGLEVQREDTSDTPVTAGFQYESES